jgi:hypothetical protein
VTRENPATGFIALVLAERLDGPWPTLNHAARGGWLDTAGHLIRAMYDAGFTIPQPTDPDHVWAYLEAQG